MGRCGRCNSYDSANCQCSHVDSDCFDLSGTGVPAYPVEANYKFDPAADNMFECGIGGLFSDMPALYRNPPRVKVHRNVVQTIPAGVSQFIEFNRPYWDEGGFFDPGGDAFRLTCPADGLYEVKFHVGTNTDITTPGSFRAEVVKNTNEESICYTEVFSPPPIDYIRNGGFEDGMNAWTSLGPFQDNSVSRSGTYSCAFTSVGTQPQVIGQILSSSSQRAIEGDVFDIGCWVRTVFDNPPAGFHITFSYRAADGVDKTVELAHTPSDFVSSGGVSFQRLGAVLTVPALDDSVPPTLFFAVDGTLTGDQAWSLDDVSALKIGPITDMGVRLRDSTKAEFKAGDYINLLVTNKTQVDRECQPNGGLDQVLEMCWAGPRVGA